jgi:dTDP-4-dehydrorhamnose 3,5-epimerase-like enzyme
MIYRGRYNKTTKKVICLTKSRRYLIGDDKMQVIKYAFQQHGDDRGQLVALEEFKDIPFEIKRVYYMYDTGEGVRRGFHAHRNLEQILICIHGSCKILLDNGMEKKVVSLEKPYEGVYVSNDIWREMYDFSSDAVLMVLASDYYKESDYIRSYDEFLEAAKDKSL